MFRLNCLNKYIPFLILFVMIFMLFSILSYELLNYTPKPYCVIKNNNKISIDYEIKKKDDAIYININDYNKIFNDTIYFDKVSRKIIFTTDELGLYKERINEANLNAIYNDSFIWYNLDKLSQIYSKKAYIIKQTNTIMLLDNILQNSTILKNNTDIYYAKNKNSLYDFKLNYGNEVNIVNIDDKSQWTTITFEYNKNSYIGYVLNKNIKYKKNQDINKDRNNYNEQMVMLVSENDQLNIINNINTVSIDLMRVVSAKGKVKINDRNNSLKTLKGKNIKVYACIDNEYYASNYDNNLISTLLKSDESRESLIKNILSVLSSNNLTGVILNIKNLKLSDKDLYTQFVKELVAFMHNNGFNVGVRSNLEGYIDTENIMKITDFTILELYNIRTISSNVSGSHSPYSFVKNKILKYCNKGYSSNIILEIPMYSILWTERNNIVVDAEIYQARLAETYITKNKLKKQLIKSINQNYVEFIKGSICYRMWLEDEFTLKNKIKLMKQNNLKGISLYKSGYETKSIKEVLHENI